MDRLIHLLGTASAERRADDAMRGRAELQGHVRHARGVEGVEYPIGDTLTDDVHQDWRHEGASRHADAVKEDEFFGPEQWFEERPGRLDVLDLILTAFRRKSVESLERVEIRSVENGADYRPSVGMIDRWSMNGKRRGWPAPRVALGFLPSPNMNRLTNRGQHVAARKSLRSDVFPQSRRGDRKDASGRAGHRGPRP
ncbi:MAG: hypothetical protein WAV18_02775, partial [Roseiarcus sp.]